MPLPTGTLTFHHLIYFLKNLSMHATDTAEETSSQTKTHMDTCMYAWKT